LHQVEVDLSELYTVYWEYVEKAKGYVQSQGSTIFEEGSQSQAVLRMMAQYGAVPQEAYAGMQPGQPFHDHAALHEEMQAFLHGVKQNHMWHEGFVVETIRGILDRYLTPPPETFEYQGQTYTPKRFFDEVMRLNLDDYVDLISLLEKPTYTYVSYDVPDNWWQGSAYFNVTLEDFMATLRRSMAEGYSICLGGDVSEGGYLPLKDVAMVPSYDIPSQYIDAYARQFRFSNQTTTDDHGIHCVGTTQVDGEHWYLIKDSGSGSRNGREPGYYFYHEDYIKLKMMNIMVHKDMVTELLQRQQP
jgi:bleomycin hydrolase